MVNNKLSGWAWPPKFLAGMLLFPALFVAGQEDRSTGLEVLNSLSGREFKVMDQDLPAKCLYRAGVLIGAFIPVKPGDDAFGEGIIDSIVKTIFTDPALFESLRKELGGEFLIGGSGGQGNLSNEEISPAASFGLTFGRNISEKFLFSLDYIYRRHHFGAEFPVIVIQEETGHTQNLNGELSSEIICNQVEFKSEYYFTRSRIRPYAGVGVMWLLQKQEPAQVTIGAKKFDLSQEPVRTNHPGASIIAGTEASVSNQLAISLDFQYQYFLYDDETAEASGLLISLTGCWRFGQ